MESLNSLAWKKLKGNKLSFTALCYIITCVIIGIFATVISPDNTKYANEMHVELATQTPFTNVSFVEFPTNKIIKNTFFESALLGFEKSTESIPIDSFRILNDELLYFPINSKIEKKYLGEYNIKEHTFWLGSDKFGRDFLSRLLYGIRISLSVGFFAVTISLIIGIILGLISGYYGGLIDDIVMWFVNVIWSIPTLLMVIAITLALGKGYWQVFFAIGLTMWVEVARIVRGQVLIIRELEYIEASRVLAYKSARILYKHILPNVFGPIIVISSANFAAAILIEAGLSFLGIGIQPPIPSWGGIIRDHYNYIIMGKEFLAIIPGLAIMSLVLSFMILGNGLRDAFDVKTK